MFSIIGIITLIAALSVAAVFIYYIIYSRHINAIIASGETTGKRMPDIPKQIAIVILIALLVYSLIITLALNNSRNQVTGENRDTFSVINPADYTYSSYNGTLTDKDASYAKLYSRESNEGYKKTVSQDGEFIFTVFTRTGPHDAFHPDFFCFVEYTGEKSEELSFYESYEYLDADSMESIDGIGSGGAAMEDCIMVIGNVNDSDAFRISLSVLDSEGEEAYFAADQKAYEDDKGDFPKASDYAVSTGSIVIIVP